MDNFKLIYRILRFLEAMSKQAEFDEDSFTAEHFGVEDGYFKNTLAGLEYLHGNESMLKAAADAKGIK